MRTSEERVAELHRRMNSVRQAERRRQYLQMGALVSAALVILLSVSVGISRLPVQPDGVGYNGMTASIFASSSALGYIVVVIVGLCLGALATVFCYRVKRHMEEEEKADDRKF